MAFCAHYVGDLSQPLHNIRYTPYNQQYHTATDGIINHEMLYNLPLIEIYPIDIRSEMDLAKEIARVPTYHSSWGTDWKRKDGCSPDRRLMNRSAVVHRFSRQS